MGKFTDKLPFICCAFVVVKSTFNVGYTFADNEGREIKAVGFQSQWRFSINANSTTFELTTLSDGGYLAWYPKGSNVENVYYGIIVKKDSVALAYFNGVNHEANYILDLATEQFVNNKITGAINSNY